MVWPCVPSSTQPRTGPGGNRTQPKCAVDIWWRHHKIQGTSCQVSKFHEKTKQKNPTTAAQNTTTKCNHTTRTELPWEVLLSKYITNPKRVSNSQAWEQLTVRSIHPNLRQQFSASGWRSYSPVVFSSFLHPAGQCQPSVLDIFSLRAEETANIAKLQRFAAELAEQELLDPELAAHAC